MSSDAPDQRIGFLESINTILRRKMFIIVNVVIVTGIAVAVAFMLPKTYVSSATLIPPKNNDPFSALASGGSSLLKQFGSLRSLGVMNDDMYRYVAILESRALQGRIVDQFNLVKVYEAENRLEAMDVLSDQISTSANEEGTMTLKVQDEIAERAQEMCAFTIQTMDSINTEIATREARNNRQFIADRMEENISNMEKAEVALQKFQEEYGIVPVTSEVSQSADAMAELYSEKMLKEFELEYFKRALGENTPQLESAQMQLDAITQKMNQFPELGMQSFRLLREFLVQQKIYEFIAPLYEHAKIMENKNTPTVLVLDTPLLPDKPAFPKKRLIVLVFFLFALLLSIGIVLVQARIQRLQAESPAVRKQVETMFDLLKFKRNRATE